jgi:tetratricopeptide (TPR) repeat protein
LQLERRDQALWTALREFRALQDLNQAIQRGGDEGALARNHANRGRLLDRHGHSAEALADLKISLIKDPEYALAYLWLGEAYLHDASPDEQHYLEAIAAFDAYLKRDSTVGPKMAAAYRGRGLARDNLKQHADAIQDYGRALEIEPDAYTHASRGWAYLAIGAHEPALKDFDSAIRLNPERAEPHSGQGLALVKVGKHPEGVAAASTALRLGPDSSRLEYNACRVFAQAVARLDREPRTRANQETRREYLHLAMTSLRQAFQMPPPAGESRVTWRQQILRDPALEPIRNDPGFARLVPKE